VADLGATSRSVRLGVSAALHKKCTRIAKRTFKLFFQSGTG